MPDNDLEKPKVRFKYLLLLSFGLLIIYGLITTTDFSFEQFYIKWKELTFGYWLLILLITGLMIYLNSYRWKLLVSPIANIDKFPKGFFYYYASLSAVATYFINQTLGNISVKAISLKCSQDVKLPKGSMTGLVEHLLSLIVLFVLTLPSALYVLKIISAFFAIMVSVLLLFILAISIFLWHEQLLVGICNVLNSFCLALNKIPFIKKKKLVALPVTELKTIYTQSFIVKLLCYSIILYYIHVLRYYIFALALNLSVPALPLVITFPIVYFAAIIGFTPGALGIIEMGWFGLLMSIGVDTQQATIYVIGQRVLNIISIVFVFIVAYILYYVIPLKKTYTKDKNKLPTKGQGGEF